MAVYIHNYFELICLLVAVLCYKKLKGSFMIWFIPYLAFIIVGEVFAASIKLNANGSNSDYYLTINAVSFYFFSFVFYQLTDSKVFRKIIISVAPLIPVVMYILFSELYRGINITIIFTSVILSAFCCLYFYFTMNNDSAENDHTYISGFWIASGLLIFYVGIIIVFSMMDFIRENKLLLWGNKLYQLIPRLLSIILYSCFSISFVLWKGQKTPLSSQS